MLYLSEFPAVFRDRENRMKDCKTTGVWEFSNVCEWEIYYFILPSNIYTLRYFDSTPIQSCCNTVLIQRTPLQALRVSSAFTIAIDCILLAQNQSSLVKVSSLNTFLKYIHFSLLYPWEFFTTARRYRNCIRVLYVAMMEVGVIVRNGRDVTYPRNKQNFRFALFRNGRSIERTRARACRHKASASQQKRPRNPRVCLPPVYKLCIMNSKSAMQCAVPCRALFTVRSKLA